MTEYHVGGGIFEIYAGTLKKNGKEWRNKSTVTREALSAAACYLWCNDKEFHFTHKGKSYVMQVIQLEEGEQK